MYGKNNEGFEVSLSPVKIFSDDMGMEFGLEKRAKATLTDERLTSTSNIKLDGSTSIRELDQEKTYK